MSDQAQNFAHTYKCKIWQEGDTGSHYSTIIQIEITLIKLDIDKVQHILFSTKCTYEASD